MTRVIAGVALVLVIYLCAAIASRKEKKEMVLPGYVSVDTVTLIRKGKVYVPVNVTRNSLYQNTKTILKVRNTSFSDTIYLSGVEFYDKQGRMVNKLLDSFLLVRPMATTEIVIKGEDIKKTVDNFIVQWHSNSDTIKPIVQAITMDNRNRILVKETGVPLH